MPYLIGEVEVTNEVSLAPSSVLYDGAVVADGDLTVLVNFFYYDLAGVKGKFCGVVAQPITDNTVNYVYLDSSANLQINTTGYPSSSLVHIRLARVVADTGFIVRVILERALLTAAGAGLSAIQHEGLRQLIHFIDNGPAEGFSSGAYRETTGTVFPTAIIWYDQVGVGKKKIVSKEIVWSGPFPATITWKMYDASEVLLATVTDTLTYSGPFETSRTRTIA